MVPIMQYLYFVRHGESEFNKANKWAGSSDTPLTSLGHKQAQKAGKQLRKQGLAVDVIISSPLERAHETAKRIATEIDYPHDKILINDMVTERNFGSLEGKKDLLSATKYFVDESSIDNHDGAETLEELQKRAEDLLEYLHSLPHDTIVVVGHGASGRALRRAVTKGPLSVRGGNIGNAEVVRLI